MRERETIMEERLRTREREGKREKKRDRHNSTQFRTKGENVCSGDDGEIRGGKRVAPTDKQ